MQPPAPDAASAPAPVNAAAPAAGTDQPPAVALPAAPAGVSRREAFAFWLRLGFISFGGPAGQIAIMHQELVERRRWISERRFLHALNYCMLLPGPEAQQLATYLGWLLHRTWGGVVAGALFVLPSLFILIALAWLYLAFGHLPWVAGLFYGVKPAVTAIVLQAAHRIGGRTLRHPLLWGIAAAAFAAIALLHLPFPLIVLLAALAGWLGQRRWPAAFRTAAGHAATGTAAHAPAVIDDDTPPPAHAIFRWSRLLALLAAGAALWLLPMALLAACFGWQGTLTQMGWFFTTAALLTFGGAYAVLPYVWQGAVVEHGWVTPAQMMDGLALGEATPGPLIMLVAFVAFIGGYVHQVFGPEQQVLAGVTAAVLVTWFTFLPSFLFILAGGPLVERTRDNLRLGAPLTAITAAVVGVIVSLALFFAWHVLWPGASSAEAGAPGGLPAFGGFDPVAAGIMLLAALALFRYRRGVLEVVAGAAAAGLAVTWLAAA